MTITGDPKRATVLGFVVDEKDMRCAMAGEILDEMSTGKEVVICGGEGRARPHPRRRPCPQSGALSGRRSWPRRRATIGAGTG